MPYVPSQFDETKRKFCRKKCGVETTHIVQKIDGITMNYCGNCEQSLIEKPVQKSGIPSFKFHLDPVF